MDSAGGFRGSITLISTVNVNLWTLPPDLCDYGIMLDLLATGIIFGFGAFEK